jgi:hypothetical protein
MNAMMSIFLGCGANLDLTVRIAIISIPRNMKAHALIAHGNPILGISFVTKILAKYVSEMALAQ